MNTKAEAVFKAWAGKRYRFSEEGAPTLVLHIRPDGSQWIEEPGGHIRPAVVDWHAERRALYGITELHDEG